MTDDELASYLDDFVSRGSGQRLDDGSLGWYDPDRGIAIIQRSEYSMTGYTMSYSDFLGRRAN